MPKIFVEELSVGNYFAGGLSLKFFPLKGFLWMWSVLACREMALSRDYQVK